MADQMPFWTGIERGRNRCFSGRVIDPGVCNETIILLRIAGYKVFLTISVRRAALVSITSYPAHTRRIIVKYLKCGL